MFFPYVKDIASSKIISININDSLNDAIQKMLQTDHRYLVVEGGHYKHIVLAQDILKLEPKSSELQQPISQSIIRTLPQIESTKNILEAVPLLQKNVDYIACVDSENNINGILSHRDLINATDPEILLENYTLNDLIKNRTHDIWVSPDTLLREVINRMHKHNKDCATVLDNNEPVGIFTIKDALYVYNNNIDLGIEVSEIMTHPVETMENTATVKQAIDFIKNKPYRRLVITDQNNKMVGMTLQKELISLAYSNWSTLMKKHQQELQEMNSVLNQKANEFEQLAAIDPLTELFNRHKFVNLYRAQAMAMSQQNQATSLLMVDIDHFKSINDTHGHNIGDLVLVATAKLLKHSVRNIDIIGRWGGEEFVILLPTVDLETAQLIAEKIRLNIQQHKFINNIDVTISIGIHQINYVDELEESVARADQALYNAKKNGRNRVEIYTQ